MNNPQTERDAKPVFGVDYYVGHIFIVTYILTGLGVQLFYYLKYGGFRVLSVATWPWILTGSSFLLLLSSVLYFFALLAIAHNMKARLDELDISWFTVLPYILYVFIWLAMTGRLLVYYISPEGIFIGA
jgi:hypothetical protein